MTHRAVIHSAEFGRVKLFVTANQDATGAVREVFITCDASGSCLDGFCDAWSTAISMLLQHGETVEDLALKFAGMEFEPKGWTENPDVRNARSVPDYVMRFLGKAATARPEAVALPGGVLTAEGERVGAARPEAVALP